MKKIGLKYLLILFFGLSFQNIDAQIKTKFGDDVSTLDGIVKAYYNVVSVKKGEKVSYERDSLLHVPNALVGGVQIQKDGKPILDYITLKEYHRVSDPFLENGFYEKEISRKTEIFGAVTHVWSTYESRITEDSEVIDRGINSIEFFFDGIRYWITSWIFDSEREGNKLPKEYL